MPQNDFMSDVAQRLNIESSKNVKEDKKSGVIDRSNGFFASFKGGNSEPKLSRKNSKRNNSTDNNKKKVVPSSLEMTQQLFAIP